MGARGPVKKPAAVHKARGTFRPHRHNDVRLPVQIPDMPPDLSPAAQAHWNVLTQKLLKAGLVADLDGTFLRLLCEECALYLEICDEIRIVGLLPSLASGLLKARHSSFTRLRAMGRDFGLSPSARTGLNIDIAQENDDDVSSIVGFHVVS